MIIGFAGKAASGKSTAAKFLLARQELDMKVLPLAAALRDEVETFVRTAGSAADVPLIYGDQEAKLKIFYVDEAVALQICSQWADFLKINADIQDRPGKSALTVRRILQWWGTEYRRAQNPDYWTLAWEKKLAQFDLAQTHVLVDDVRFCNELNMIKSHGGHFIRIVRPGFAGANNHSSENSLDNYAQWDLVLVNDGSLEHFEEQIEKQILPLLLP